MTWRKGLVSPGSWCGSTASCTDEVDHRVEIGRGEYRSQAPPCRSTHRPSGLRAGRTGRESGGFPPTAHGREVEVPTAPARTASTILGRDRALRRLCRHRDRRGPRGVPRCARTSPPRRQHLHPRLPVAPPGTASPPSGAVRTEHPGIRKRIRGSNADGSSARRRQLCISLRAAKMVGWSTVTTVLTIVRPAPAPDRVVGVHGFRRHRAFDDRSNRFPGRYERPCAALAQHDFVAETCLLCLNFRCWLRRHG